MPEDVLDVILRLSNLQSFVAGSRAAAAEVRNIGTASEEANAKSRAASSRMAGVAGLATKALTGTAVAAAAVGYESVKMGVNFDKQMEMIHTQAGASQQEVSKMSAAILKMDQSGKYAQGPQELAMGLFHLESIGLRGSRALNALKIAADGAAVGNASLEETTTALGSAALVGIKGAGNLRNVMALMNATVGAGNMRMEDLVTSMGTGVLPAAKLAGLGIKDVFGALAVLSDEGWRGSSAMAQLATSLHYITDPTQKARDALKSLHMGAFDMANAARGPGGLVSALQLLKDHLAKLSPTQRAATLGDILPAGRGRVLEVLMNQTDRYDKKMAQISHTTGQYTKDIAATHQTAAFKIHAAWAQVQADMVKIGHVLQPVAVIFAKGVADMFNALIKLPQALSSAWHWITALPGPIKLAGEGIIIMVAATTAWIALTAGLSLLAAGWALVTGAIETARIAAYVFMMDNPILLAVAAIITIVVLLVTHWKAARNVLLSIWHAIESAFNKVVNAIGDAVKWLINFIGKHWKLILSILTGPIGAFWIYVATHLKQIGGFFSGLWTGIVNVFKGAPAWFGGIAKGIWHMFTSVLAGIGRWLVGVFKGAVNLIISALNIGIKGINSVIQSIPNPGDWFGASLPTIPQIPKLWRGGTVTHPGMAIVGDRGPEILSLPKGARVSPMRTQGQRQTPLATGFDGTIVVPVVIDGKEVARAVGKYSSDRLARR